MADLTCEDLTGSRFVRVVMADARFERVAVAWSGVGIGTYRRACG
jgi:hypothetical protein